MKPGIKICGLQPGDDLSFTVHTQVQHVGFVFVSASRRYLSPEQARPLVRSLPASCTAVGVMVDEDIDRIEAICERAELRHVQLHGRETPEFCRQLKTRGYTVWKALSVPDRVEGDLAVAMANRIRPFLDTVDGILLDAAPPARAQTVTGGHGRRFDWQVLPSLADLLGSKRPPLWIAGGIRPDNVGECLSLFVPDGLDVSSGVEVGGRKSPERIQALIQAVVSTTSTVQGEREFKQAVTQS
ncbi:MAG: phosphoribosylanthranilate isomerase [Alicyclobacillus herbarius]|uniref:phosphoribosylanthranilate isomerase n=1 Tax=Alicyclobacillus herbarius TaxID=122960 RepID=UPI0023527696|nr:phosphoribosylanthranilate isomerase [Alicyclobacillus herbarius]MCL6632866.1 phosphoribosylanthranilate isomerase [Alicyclobacillus herbarius]